MYRSFDNLKHIAKTFVAIMFEECRDSLPKQPSHGVSSPQRSLHSSQLFTLPGRHRHSVQLVSFLIARLFRFRSVFSPLVDACVQMP